MTNGRAKDSFGAHFYSYVAEKNMERRLGRALSADIEAKPFAWGKLGERRCFEVLSTEYELVSNITLVHPTIHWWKGSPDSLKGKDVVGEIKCPWTLKAFCELVDPYIKDGVIVHPALSIEAVLENHEHGAKYFWQIVSNGVLTGSKYGELIIHMPYESEIEKIQAMAAPSALNEEIFKWIYYASPSSLPYILDGGHYKNLNKIKFEIKQEWVDSLTYRMEEAGKLLVNV